MSERASVEGRMGQETWLMYADLACSLYERYKAVEDELRHKPKSGVNPVVTDIEEAYRLVELRAQKSRLGAELAELASEMVREGIPLDVCIRHQREGKSALNIRVSEVGRGHKLFVGTD